MYSDDPARCHLCEALLGLANPSHGPPPNQLRPPALPEHGRHERSGPVGKAQP